jgi:hypothetical protein
LTPIPENERFIGTWQLVSQHSEFPDGRKLPSRGEHPRGVLIYDPYGNMSVQLMRTDDRALESHDLLELTTAMQHFHAYFGTYEVRVTERVVLHHVLGSGFPGYWNTTQQRHFEFSENDTILTLRAPAPNDDSMRVLVWQRLTTVMQ